MSVASVTAASVVSSGVSAGAVIFEGTAGATLTAGMPVYLAADGTYKAVTANGVSPTYKYAGIVLESASSGQPIKICQRDPAFTPGFTVTVGTVYVCGASAGAIHPAADLTTGWFASVVGVGISATQINLFNAQNCRADVAI